METTILGLYWVYIWDNGKDNRSYYNQGIGYRNYRNYRDYIGAVMEKRH